MVRVQSLPPVIDCRRRNDEAGGNYLSGAARTATSSRPREESEDCSRRPNAIAEIKMISARIIKVNRPLNQSQPKKLRVKIEVALRIGRDRSNVMDSAYFHAAIDACICGKS